MRAPVASIGLRPAIDGAGDLDGDGYDDVAVGARGNDAGGSAAGAVYLIRGSASPWSGSLAAADVSYTGAGADEWAGFAVALIPDLDADGFDDLAIGSPAASGGVGSVAVFRGGASLGSGVTTDADTTLTGTNAGDVVDYTLSANGDIDADGYADLLIGAYRDDTAGSGTGAAYLILGTGS